MIFSDFQSFMKPSTKNWKSANASNAPDLTFGDYLHSLRRAPLPLASLARPLHPHISSIRPPPIWTPRTLRLAPLAGIPMYTEVSVHAKCLEASVGGAQWAKRAYRGGLAVAAEGSGLRVMYIRLQIHWKISLKYMPSLLIHSEKQDLINGDMNKNWSPEQPN